MMVSYVDTTDSPKLCHYTDSLSTAEEMHCFEVQSRDLSRLASSLYIFKAPYSAMSVSSE